MKYIEAEKLIKFKEILADIIVSSQGICTYQDCKDIAEREALLLIATIQQEQPDKETILRICKLHKAWSIFAPFENVEDFIMTNWNAENIV